MARHRRGHFGFSRRDFLKTIRWAPAIFLPAPFLISQPRIPGLLNFPGALAFSDFRITPHYPAKSPLDDLLQQVDPGSDEYVLEKRAQEITELLAEWSRTLKTDSSSLDLPAKLLDPAVEATALTATQEIAMRAGGGINIVERRFGTKTFKGREHFLQELKGYLAACGRYETAEFLVVGIDAAANDPTKFDVDIRFDLVGEKTGGGREQRIGQWRTRWSRDGSGEWRILVWTASRERVSRARKPAFIDITSQALGQAESYRSQILRGADYWRTLLDGACGIDVYGNNGLAAGDIDNDGFDDLYLCQPPGLPNRLYRNRGDGTFEDLTEAAGVGVLDGTACALFADFENKGVQDLLVVCASGPLLFLNQG